MARNESHDLLETLICKIQDTPVEATDKLEKLIDAALEIEKLRGKNERTTTNDEPNNQYQQMLVEAIRKGNMVIDRAIAARNATNNPAHVVVNAGEHAAQNANTDLNKLINRVARLEMRLAKLTKNSVPPPKNNSHSDNANENDED